MALYPDDPPPSLTDWDQSDTFETVVSRFPNRLYARARLDSPRYSTRLPYTTPAHENLYRDLYRFYLSMKGGSGRFTFRDFVGWDTLPVGMYWPNLLVGVGDGVEDTWDLPMTNSHTDRVLHVAGVDLDPADWTFSAGTGVDGRDQAITDLPVDAGDIIEYSATGRRTVWARFVNDRLTWRNFVQYLRTTGIEIEEWPE